MSYIKQTVQGSYELTVNDRNKAYLSALKNFLVDNGFTFVSEDYDAGLGKQNVVLSLGNTQYSIVINNGTATSSSLTVTTSKLLDDSTTKVAGNSVSITLLVLLASVEDGGSIKTACAISSTVLLVKNQNSFALVITSSASSITSSDNIVTGNIAYKLIDGTNSDITFVNGSSFWTAEKLQGNAVTFRLAHNKLNDDRLVYENKLSVNQSNVFVGDTNEVVGLVGAEKGKIYQTEKGKYFAFANDMAIPMGDEML